MLHIPPTDLLLLTAKQEPYKKAYLLTKNIEQFSGKSLEERASRQKKNKTERVTGLGRRTREEPAKRNQMTALRFQTGERHQTSPASLRGERERGERERKRERENKQKVVVFFLSCVFFFFNLYFILFVLYDLYLFFLSFFFFFLFFFSQQNSVSFEGIAGTCTAYKTLLYVMEEMRP